MLFCEFSVYNLKITLHQMLSIKYNKCQERKKTCFIQYQLLSIQNRLLNFHGLKSFRASFFLWELFHTFIKLI